MMDETKRQAFGRIDQIREQIRAGVGRIDTLALLDAARIAEESAYGLTGPLRILFVCGGNTCRSPMAVGLAKDLFGDAVLCESAGIYPGVQTTPEAIEVMLTAYGIDISHHRPRSVTHAPLDTYDLIVAMDSYVDSDLKTRFQVPIERLVSWDVDDPFLDPAGAEAYRKCASVLQENLVNLFDRLAEIRT